MELFVYVLALTYWRASEASETLFSHVYGNSRYIRLITWVIVEYDEIFHELRKYCHEPKASGNTKYE